MDIVHEHCSRGFQKKKICVYFNILNAYLALPMNALTLCMKKKFWACE